jgi:hypothetical protein
VRLEISPPPDAHSITVWAHAECLSRARDASVAPDDPKDHGRIPARARCAFCGKALPIVGRHPYGFDAGDVSPPRRFWSHRECLLRSVVSSVAERL